MSGPENAAAAAPPPMSLPWALIYILAGVVLALSQGLGQGFVSANVQQFAGDLGISATDASWLMAAYMIPRASLSLMLVKVRTQFGLRRFAEVGIICYVAVAFGSVWIEDLRSAVVMQFLAGVTSAPLSTLAFLYFLEPLPREWKLRLGLPMALSLLMMGPSLARVISPALIGDGGLLRIHLLVLGLALVSLVLVYRLRLAPVPHEKVIKPLDLVSFALLAFGFGSITVGAIMGPIHWWTATPWIGGLLAAAIAAVAAAAIIETHRTEPLIDVRWLMTPAMLHLTGTLLLFRLLLSEQSSGAPRMFQVLGVAPEQMTALFTVICISGLLGALACVAWIKPGREPQFHFVALLLIAVGAWMDAHSTVHTRPEQMLVSQALIGFAGMLFMPPAMMAGLMAALKKGPNYLLSFIIVFLATQSLGGVIGGGLFNTLVNWRQAFHLQTLTEQLRATSPALTAEIGQRMTALAPQLPEIAERRAQAVLQIAQDAAAQAYVMAYNDLYFLIFLGASAGLALLLLHVARDRLAARHSPTPVISEPGSAQ